MNEGKPGQIRQPFRPRARLLQLLGDELISTPSLAVLELVKNAYDADASKVSVLLDLRYEERPSISVVDDGEGMSLKTLREIWLVPGDNHRQRQRTDLQRTRKYGRLPLGEKGLGRFAVHKLGNEISVVTRSTGKKECLVEIDWSSLISKQFLEDALVTISTRAPQVFRGEATGTYIEITDLRQPEWTRREVRRLQKQITSMCSPFSGPRDFQATLAVLGEEDWVNDLPDIEQILDHSIWKFSFCIDKTGQCDWQYEFREVPGLKLQRRTITRSKERLLIPPSFANPSERKVVADKSTMEGIGPIVGEFYVYDRDKEIIKHLPHKQFIEEYLNENGGIRVYRDGIRVYNYGEPGDDWLGLDLRRVNTPTRRISRNIILGAVHISLGTSGLLIEKTNREGFVSNEASDRLKRLTLGALSIMESERHRDKDRIRSLVSKANGSDPKIERPIKELRQALAQRGLAKEFDPIVAKIEHDFYSMQETLLSAGMSGLNLAVIFHEVERGVRALHQAIVEGADQQDTAERAHDLMRLLDGFSILLRKDGRSTHTAKRLIEAVYRFNVLRFRHHRINVSMPLVESSDIGFEASFSFSLMVGALNNLIDNSLYWMRVRWPDLPTNASKSPRKLYIDVSQEFDAGPALLIADTGPGFQEDSPEQLVRPFFTRKPDGMGLGLYYSSLAMQLSGGRIAFPCGNDVGVPNGFDGALVALVFRKAK